jgi:hypothetical protein
MRELLRAKGTIDYTSRGAGDRPNRATFKTLTLNFILSGLHVSTLLRSSSGPLKTDLRTAYVPMHCGNPNA